MMENESLGLPLQRRAALIIGVGSSYPDERSIVVTGGEQNFWGHQGKNVDGALALAYYYEDRQCCGSMNRIAMPASLGGWPQSQESNWPIRCLPSRWNIMAG